MGIASAKHDIRITVTPEQLAAITAHCEQHCVTIAALIRRLVLTEVGREDLIEAMLPRGRPRKVIPAAKDE